MIGELSHRGTFVACILVSGAKVRGTVAPRHGLSLYLRGKLFVFRHYSLLLVAPVPAHVSLQSVLCPDAFILHARRLTV